MSNKELDPIKDRAKIDVLVRKEADRNLRNHPAKGKLGFCHTYWAEMKSIYKNKYNIDWKTPAEENPHVMYD